jgi:hypothetical protein
MLLAKTPPDASRLDLFQKEVERDDSHAYDLMRILCPLTSSPKKEDAPWNPLIRSE